MTGKRLNTPKQYTEAQFAIKKAEAKALFMSGRNPGEIEALLGLKKSRVAQWASHYKWAIERDTLLAKTTKTRLEELMQEHEETIAELNVIRQKAYDPIFMDKVEPHKFSEASNSYIAAVEALRKLRVDSIHESFMIDLITACRELITDQDLLARIGERFREIYNSHQTSTLSSNQKMIGRGNGQAS